ncbi:hypothetical protein DDZ18_08580 [Marinicauda salina]|uniref:Probable membrane transporter protein n=1 Tax=Marinicauda salina TaxID=2135793 RepID=A0A2U2BV26_9PROT|nr:TSUP family transporter [Marinicauda salina]PWE17873.1 hypothetical protein DDZ18_08580 [Marinicauda salina]
MTSFLILLSVLGTAFLSAVFGMAGGLILMGVLAALLPVSTAMVTHGAVQSVSNGWRAILLRRFILWRALGIYAIGAAIAAAGLASVSVILPRAWLFIVLGLVPALVWLPKERLHLDARRPAHAVACGFLVTGLNVVAGVSGPLLDVFFQNAEADRRAIVATKAATQVAAHGVKIAYYVGPALAAGVGPPVWLLAAAAPLAILGTTLGSRVLHRLSDADFRNWTKRIVTAIGAIYIMRGLILLAG